MVVVLKNSEIVDLKNTSSKETKKAEENDIFLEKTENVDIQKNIWGPFYFLTSGIFQLEQIPEDASGAAKSLTWLPLLLTVIILVVRVISVALKLNNCIALSLNYSYTSILFCVSLHGFLSALFLTAFKGANYFQETINKIRQASYNEIRKTSRKTFILHFFVYFFTLVPAIIYVLENFVMFDSDYKFIQNGTFSKNETAQFRLPLVGGKVFFFIDAAMILFGAYASASALVVYLLANQAICNQYESFNNKLKKCLDEKSIMNYQSIKAFELQIIEFLDAASFITNTAAPLLDLTFMMGIFIQIQGQFALRAFSTIMIPIQNALFGFWVAESVIFLVLATNKPAKLHSLLTQTSEMLWLDRSIWKNNEDTRVQEIAQTITNRIKSVDYASRGLTPIRAANLILNAVLMIIPFFVDILSNYRHIPSYQKIN